ncbi:ATP-binding protein [Oscillatoria amoena NRMC-F 0135]|nr:ATP-binding protein [Oscillatoria amoena NRMC-F 0135]
MSDEFGDSRVEFPARVVSTSVDGYASPVFSVSSRQGVLGPALLFTLSLNLLCLVWGNLSQVVMITGTGYLISMMAVHWGVWLNRRQPEALWSHWALGFLGVEMVVLVVGGWAWSWQSLLLGLAFPLGVLGVDGAIRKIRWALFHPEWWRRYYRRQSFIPIADPILWQVSTLIVLICSATAVGWFVRAILDGMGSWTNAHLLILLLMTVVLVGVAIACWTTLPQVNAIAQAREQAEQLFKDASDAIVVVDEGGKILKANAAAAHLFGIPKNKLLRQSLTQLLPNLNLFSGKWQHRSEQSLQRSDATERTVEIVISERTKQQNPEYLVVLRDITARKQAEVALRQQAENLEKTLQELQRTQSQLIQSEKMSSLGQLVAGVAHEINNPVNFIYGNLTYADEYTRDLLALIQLYQEHYPTPKPAIQDRQADIDLDFLMEDLPRLIDSMRVGSERIQKIVASLRTFSRMDEAELKAVNIHEGIDSTLMILQNRTKAKGDRPAIEVVKNYGALPSVECYAGQLNQVFMNLLSNAIDSLEEKLHQHLAEGDRSFTPRICIDTEHCSPYVRIRIADNGLGIPESLQSRLFDPFFTTKPVGKGTGLGLAISYQIVVERHQGKMTCHSVPRQGAEFALEIPMSRLVSQ